jgi:hypothetical protein
VRVLLIDINSKIPNLALKKVERYHLDKGDEVIWDMPLAKDIADKIYVSCVFKPITEREQNAIRVWEDTANAIIGGSGYSLDIELPPEIEMVRPRINYGFTTRGCIRKCKFCIVPQKEGKIRIVGDLLDLWDGKAKLVTLLDNNILAVPAHFSYICKQARDNKIRLDFNQGLDHRLLTPEIIKEMKSISHIEYRFAFDHPSYIKTVEKAIDLLQANKINRCSWYTLIGFDTTLKDDLFRLNYLRSRNQTAYVQRYYENKDTLINIALARWANQHHIYRGMSFIDFLNHPENKRYLRLLPEVIETGVNQA